MAKHSSKRKRDSHSKAAGGIAARQPSLQFAERSKPKPRPGPPVRRVETPQTEPAAVFSFLKETKGVVSWGVRDMASALKISPADVKQILPVLELQGYVQKGSQQDEWITTPAGEVVSGAKFPRFKRQSVEQALKKLEAKISETNRDHTQPFKVTMAVAFGDFLSGRPQVQAADVGIQLEPRQARPTNAKEQQAFLRRLRPRAPLIHVRSYEPWMERRANQKFELEVG